MDWITWFTGTVQGIIKIGSLEMPNDITRGRVHTPLFSKEGLDNTDNISSFFCNNI